MFRQGSTFRFFKSFRQNYCWHLSKKLTYDRKTPYFPHWNRWKLLSLVLLQCAKAKMQYLHHHFLYYQSHSRWRSLNNRAYFFIQFCRLDRKCFPDCHYVKIVRIPSFSSPYFPAFGLNTEMNYVNLRIQSEYGK